MSATDIVLNDETDFLMHVDPQLCFMPGGALAVPEGDEIVPTLNALSRLFKRKGASKDAHGPKHKSFAASHDGRAEYEEIDMPYGRQRLWPVHGVRGTRGAEFHPDLESAGFEIVVAKGFRDEIDSYSAFFENDRRTSTGFGEYLRATGVTRVFFDGLAEDFCVGFSAEDAADLGFEVVVILDACRGIGIPLAEEDRLAAGLPEGATTIDAMRARLAAKGVRFVTAAELGADLAAGGPRP